MPGHKGHGDFKVRFPEAAMDITELDWSDNLLSPNGVIASAQKDIAEILGAKKAFITTDGSTSGVYAMLYCASKFGNKIVVFRNSHQSVWNGCKLFGLEPLVVQGKEIDGVLQPPDGDIIEKLISSDVNISGILATSPDYYGNVANLSRYASIVKKYNRLLLVDEAHGACLAFGDKKGYAGQHADMWVDGAHKTLPTLTQGAIVCVNKESLLPLATDALSMFRTTSPSYPIMASVEFGVKYLYNNPKVLFKTKSGVEEFKNTEKDLTIYHSDDWTKLLIDFKPLNISPDLVFKSLQKKGVHAEFSDGRYILFYLSPLTALSELPALKKKILSFTTNKRLKNTYREKPSIPEGDRSYSFQYALRKQSEWLNLDDAVGRMCAQNAGTFPPCIPVVVAGEMITVAAIKALSREGHTFGVKDGKICVVKKW